MFQINLKWLYLLFSGLLYAGCNTAVPEQAPQIDPQAVRHFMAPVQDGDLVLRLGNDITSNMLAQLNLKDKRFSHIGICFTENGAKMVYHSLGAEYGTHNFLRKDSLQVFFDLADNLSIGYVHPGFNTDIKQQLHDTLEQWYRQQLPFDMDFNWQSDDKMYCSEMVAKAIMRTGDTIHIPITDTLGRKYYAIDNILNALTIDTIAYYSRSLPKL